MSTIKDKAFSIFKTLNSKYFLGFISFIESIFFPIPTDAVLIPMVLSKRYNWINLALLATITSVLGGVVGYLLGGILFEHVNSFIADYGFLDEFYFAQQSFIEYGVLILFISSFTPVPYKIFTITAGFMSINIFLFILVSLFGRGLRFFLVSYLANKYQEKIIMYTNKYILQITFLFLIIFLIYKLYN